MANEYQLALVALPDDPADPRIVDDDGHEVPQGEIGEIVVDARQMTRGYLGQDDPVLHFGLGANTAVDVVVTFPDGTEITRSNDVR